MLTLSSKLTSLNYPVLLTALEHRYYGSSYPEKGSGYQYLTTPQAIADVKGFLTYVKETILTPTTPTLTYTFGGSYPGMVSAFSRFTYPDYVQGSVSSSSPVQATVEMKEYNEVVGNALEMEEIGGSMECLDIVVKGHSQIGEMLSNVEGRSELADVFNICGGEEMLEESRRNREVFAGDGVVYVPAQENDPSCEGELCNIEKICKFLTGRKGEQEEEEDVEEWRVLASLAAAQNGGECVNISWEERITELQSPASILGGTKSWLYQTCTGWGFYQTCPLDSTCPYSKGYHGVDQDLEICERVFNVSKEEVYDKVDKSNGIYGGWNIEDDRILFVNGNVDPWSALSVTPTNGEIEEGTCKEKSFWVEGASHHFWTHEVLDTDGEDVQEARERIHDTVIGWITDAGEYS